MAERDANSASTWLGEIVRQHGGLVEHARWLKQDGKLLNQARLPETDTPAIALHRADLQQTLLHALPRDSIHLDHVFETCEQLPDKLIARFRGGSSFDCDVLIGADGLHARAALLSDGPPIDRGHTTYLSDRG